MRMMRIDAHVLRIGRYIRMAKPSLDQFGTLKPKNGWTGWLAGYISNLTGY